MLSFLAFCASILIFPYVPYGYQNKRKLTLACGFLTLGATILWLSIAIWWIVASFSNGLGWVSGAQQPVQFVQPYVAAWKPAWCCWLSFFFCLLSLIISGVIFWMWKGMPDFDAEGFIKEKLAGYNNDDIDSGYGLAGNTRIPLRENEEFENNNNN